MSTKVETYIVKKVGDCPVVVWQSLCDFGEKRWEQGAKSLLEHMDKNEKNFATWDTAFDFCRLSGMSDALNSLTEKYASLFGKAPPEWLNREAKASVVNTNSKGVTLNIISVSNPESEQYDAVRANLEKSKTALLLKFTPGMALSWQTNAVNRLWSIISDAMTWKLPIFGENLEVVQKHILNIKPESRSAADWEILFFTLRGLNLVTDFDDQAIEYAIAKGMSPPTFTPLMAEDKTKWFDSATNDTEVMDTATGDTVVANGSLANALHNVRTKVLQRLQNKPSVTVDMHGIEHIDFSSAMDFVSLHDKVRGNKREIYVSKTSPIIKRMLTTLGLPESSFKEK